MDEDIKSLENFLIDNRDFERLENLLNEFNIFETLGAVNVELRHSEFLAYLMNPHQNHGLGEAFVKRFLQKAIIESDSDLIPFSAIELSLLELEDIEVRREWQNIDILLLSEKHQLAIIVENKIKANEHSDQLNRYYTIVEAEFPGWSTVGLFLNPEGDISTDDRYIAISYDMVCDLIEDICNTRKSSLGPDVLTLMQHYTKMLRRNILSGSVIEELSRKIYKKHKRALDILSDYKPDQQNELREFCESLIGSTENIIMDDSIKARIRFIPEQLDFPILKYGRGWTGSGRTLLFLIFNEKNYLHLTLYLAKGKSEIKEKMYNIAKNNKSIFKLPKNMGGSYTRLYKKNILSKEDYKNKSMEELQLKIEQAWSLFYKNELPQIIESFSKEGWLHS